MKKQLKKLIPTLCLISLLSSHNLVSAATTAQLTTLFSWAESTFPLYFPEPQTTQEVDPWTFNLYSTGIYIAENNGEIYVYGGVFGTVSPTYVDTLDNLLALIASTGGDGSAAACDTTSIPEGMSVTQDGNTVNVSTNGQCIAMPENQTGNFCAPPVQPTATGISVLSTTNTTSFQTTGLTIDIQGIPNPLDTIQSSLSSTTCTINVPAEDANFVVNSDICFDVTDQYSGLSDLPGVGITINPPVTLAYTGTTTGQVVANCFATDATVVSDAVTGETWVRGADGNFVQTSF